MRNIVAEELEDEIDNPRAPGHMSFVPAESFSQLREQRRGLLLWVSSSSPRGGTPPYLAQ